MALPPLPSVPAGSPTLLLLAMAGFGECAPAGRGLGTMRLAQAIDKGSNANYPLEQLINRGLVALASANPPKKYRLTVRSGAAARVRASLTAGGLCRSSAIAGRQQTPRRRQERHRRPSRRRCRPPWCSRRRSLRRDTTP